MSMKPPTPPPDHRFVIIGTGFSGLGMAVALEKAGERDFILLERAAEVGGTWRDNTYPGCACDIPSHLYSFSFEQNPGWSRSYSGWKEIWDYLIGCSKKYGLRDRIRFSKNVTQMRYDDEAHQWRIFTADGATVTARYVVAATGPLLEPIIPKVDGLDAFDGPVIHSGRWDHDIDLSGKRVAVVGTGASSIQIIPALAPKVGRLGVFQRTPPWVLPRNDYENSDGRKTLFRRSSTINRAYRHSLYWQHEARAVAFIKSDALLGLAERFARRFLTKEIADTALRDKVTPNYRLGCKRILLSDDYYATLCRDNVDVLTGGLGRVEGNTLVSRDGESFEADAIVLGTGFYGNKPLFGLDVFGADGRSLKQEWDRTGPEGFYGACVAGYPNFFTLHGPNTGTGHNSVIYMLEAQIELVLRVIGFAAQRGATAVDVKAGAQADFNRELTEKLSGTVWQTGGCHSWYQTDSGKNVVIWPGFTYDFKRRTQALPESVLEFSP